MYIDGIGNETTRKMRLYSMYVFIPNKRERDLKGKTYIELDFASTNNMLYSNAFDDMYFVLCHDRNFYFYLCKIMLNPLCQIASYLFRSYNRCYST